MASWSPRVAVEPGLVEPGQNLIGIRPAVDQIATENSRAPRQMTDRKIAPARKPLADGVSPRDVAENLGVSVPTLYRRLPASERAGRTIFSVF